MEGAAGDQEQPAHGPWPMAHLARLAPGQAHGRSSLALQAGTQHHTLKPHAWPYQPVVQERQEQACR